jgi:Uma2 family endonuclease
MSDAIRLIEEEISPAEERIERIYGVIYAMAAPNAVHQAILREMFFQLKTFFDGKPCEPWLAPFDLYPLAGSGDNDTVVQPDMFVVCDKERLKLEGYYGPPPLIIEILSQNRSHDLVTKLNLYHKAGVEEYITVDPEYKIVMTFTHSEEAYNCNTYSFTDRVPSRRFPPLFFDFSFPLPFQE